MKVDGLFRGQHRKAAERGGALRALLCAVLLFAPSSARPGYRCGRCAQMTAPTFLNLVVFGRVKLTASAVVMGGYSQVLFGLKGERWAEEDAKMNTLFSNPAWMFPLIDDTPERLRGGGAGSQYWARRPGDAHQSCPV